MVLTFVLYNNNKGKYKPKLNTIPNNNQKMEITTNNNLPGITMNGTEFIVDESGEVRTFHNKREVEFEQLPEYVFNTIKKIMNNACATICEMKAFVPKYFGGYDRSVDIDENGNASAPEYIHGNATAFFDNRKLITEAQLRVLKNIRYTDSEIGDKIFLSKFTVSRHVADMLANSGFKNRIELALWALNKGIIE